MECKLVKLEAALKRSIEPFMSILSLVIITISSHSMSLIYNRSPAFELRIAPFKYPSLLQLVPRTAASVAVKRPNKLRKAQKTGLLRADK